MSVDFIQILYEESQREQLYPFAKGYFNCGLTPYFENSIIAGIVPILQADYISVCSWRLRQKRGDKAHALGGLGRDALTLDMIEAAAPFDVAILTPHGPSHQPLAMAVNWHRQAWVNAFEDFKNFLRKFGKVPQELTHSIYENHFIARKPIYHDYVSNYLIPAIGYISDNPLYFVDSLYVPKKKDAHEIQRVKKLLKANDWPILPFILERLFSFYIEGKGFNVIKL